MADGRGPVAVKKKRPIRAAATPSARTTAVGPFAGSTPSPTLTTGMSAPILGGTPSSIRSDRTMPSTPCSSRDSTAAAIPPPCPSRVLAGTNEYPARCMARSSAISSVEGP